MTATIPAGFSGRAREQYRPGWSLPAYHFLSSECYENDLYSMQEKMWWLAGHVSQLGKTGDFKLFRFARESIILVRDKSGNVNAFYNVCRHRAMPVCLQAEGNTRRFSCRYHGWTYKLDGSLLPPGGMPEEFDAKNYGLKRCHVEILDGLIFLSLAAGTPPSFEEFAGNLRPFLKPYALDRTKVADEEHFPTTSNWKVSIENVSECHHCMGVHKDMMRVVTPSDSYTSPVDIDGQSWDERMLQLNRPVHMLRDDASSRYLQRAAPMALAPGNLSFTKDGKPCSKLLGDMTAFSGGWTVISFSPFLHAYLSDDYVQLLCYTPLDAENTDGKLYWLVAEDAVEGIDYDRAALTSFGRQIMMEDVGITDALQAGIASVAYAQAPLALDEKRLTNFHDWYFNHFVPDHG